MLVQVAENEALYSDSQRMVEAASRDGIDVDLDIYMDSVHVFPVFDFLPESREVLKRVSKFVDQHTHR